MATTYSDRFGNSEPSGSVILTPLMGTSTSSQSVSTSSGLTFSVQNNRAWRAGTRLRVSSTDAPPSKIMEGEVVAYSGSSSLVLEVDYTEGSGSTDSWTLNVTGARGSSGATGNTGSSGADGQGLATGGMTNDLLYKNSTADFGTGWRSLSDQLDAVSGSTANGAIIYRSTGWRALAPSNSTGHLLTVTSTAGGLGWVANTAGLPRSYLAGLTLSNGVDATNDINVGAGTCRDDGNATDLTLAATNVKQLDVEFAEYSVIGTASGGRAAADNTTGAKWFHVYLIGGSGKNTQAFFATSSSPTLPSGFTTKRHIGWIHWTGSAIRGFTQRGDSFEYTTPVAESSHNPTTSRTLKTLTVPPSLMAYLRVSFEAGTADNQVIIQNPAEADAAASASHCTLASGSAGDSGDDASILFIRVDSSSQVATRQRAGTTSELVYFVVLGWTDTRGRDD